jgi:hypothetical protein
MTSRSADTAPGAGVGAGLVEAPRLGPVSVALWLSGLRCVVTYLVLPALAPVLGATVVLAVPLILALYALGIAASVRAAWRSAQRGRWLTAGLATVLLALNVLSLVSVVGRGR